MRGASPSFRSRRSRARRVESRGAAAPPGRTAAAYPKARTHRPRYGRAAPLHTRRPLSSTVMARWISQGAMGERPGTNQDFFLWGQLGVGSPPETAHTSTRFTPDGGREVERRQVGIGRRPANRRSRRTAAPAALTPTNAGLLSRVEVAHPHRHHVGPHQPHRPGVAKAPRGAGLPRHASRAFDMIGARIVGEHIDHQKARLRAQHAHTFGRGIRLAPAQRPHHAAIAQGCIQGDQLFHGDLGVAQRDARARSGPPI